MSVEFEDYSVRVEGALKEAAIAFLHEAAGEVVSQTQRNTSVGKVSGGKTKGYWKYKVDESELKATIGNPDENAIWEEFGTGEYAVNGDGRKGGWYIKIGNGQNEISQSVVDAYGFKVVYGKNGVKYAFTKGKKPKRAFEKAFTSLKPSIIRRAEQVLKARIGD